MDCVASRDDVGVFGTQKRSDAGVKNGKNNSKYLSENTGVEFSPCRVQIDQDR